MATTWGTNQKKNDNTYTGATISSWSRQQKLAMISGFVILGVLLTLSACSKQKSVPVTSSNMTQPAVTPATTTTTAAATTPVPPVTTPKKKVHKKRPANVTYSEPNYGVSFQYPRKYQLTAGDEAKPVLEAMGALPMNFVEAGGEAVAMVKAPETSYPGTDFSAALFAVNVNRSVSEQQCAQFAFVDDRNADGEAIDPEQVEVGPMKLSKTSDFNGGMMKQADAEYFHSFQNGACYEFVLGLGTEGYGAKDGIEPVDRTGVFAKLEKILASVKINPVEEKQLAVKTDVENK